MTLGIHDFSGQRDAAFDDGYFQGIRHDAFVGRLDFGYFDHGVLLVPNERSFEVDQPEVVIFQRHVGQPMFQRIDEVKDGFPFHGFLQDKHGRRRFEKNTSEVPNVAEFEDTCSDGLLQ